MPGRILPDLTQRAPAPEPPKKRRGMKPRFTMEQVSACLQRGMTNDATRKELGCSLGTVARYRKLAGFTRKRGAKIQARNTPKRLSRFESTDVLDRAASMPAVNHPALSEARTIYPATVTPIEGTLHILIGGVNSWKIGAQITKGKWKGFPIYTLTLEERATCPTSCALWRSCYGNSMHFAKRLQHGPELEDRLGHELAILQSRHPRGFAVRLHVLGDFYSVEYVKLWRSFVGRFKALHVFGFSARHNVDKDPIAAELVRLTVENWERFAIRFSNAPLEQLSTVTVEHPLQKPDDAIQCPQQVGKTQSCGSCALCWQSKRRIAFLRH